ncbi:MAG TPA: hypothetical protein VGJ19_05520 [Streptosporangiaceae bacterium]
MSITAEAPEFAAHDQPEPAYKIASFTLPVPGGISAQLRNWKVDLYSDAGQVISRQVWLDREPVQWAEKIIWPTWVEQSPDEVTAAAAPLEKTQDYWSTAGTRLRDSAKWTATVLGAGLAALVGTSPLRDMNRHTIPGPAIALALSGLVLVAITLILVLLVMCPKSVSLEDVEHAREHRLLPSWAWLRTPLYKWRKTVESEQDLYLPCGINSVLSLRQSMSIEECTLMALSKAGPSARDEQARTILHNAQTARIARLLELRTAASRVATIGEYYNLKRRSARATYGGVSLGVAATACIVAAFAWPVS